MPDTEISVRQVEISRTIAEPDSSAVASCGLDDRDDGDYTGSWSLTRLPGALDNCLRVAWDEE
jgi:hypothetical protein